VSTLSAAVRDLSARRPDVSAFVETDHRLTWWAYDQGADWLAGDLVDAGLERGERVAVLLPDGPLVHAVYLAAERAGLVVTGIGPRAGRREIEHLIGKTGAAALVSPAVHREHDFGRLVTELRSTHPSLRRHLVLEDSIRETSAEPAPADRALGIDELFLLNSTSGTTGLPKCVMHNQRRWLAFHEYAIEAGELSGDDVFMSVIPAPFGFGLWTAHFTPTLLGAPTVLMAQFTPEAMIELIERERVTVLAAVSTQFIMMLGSPALANHDVTSLRVLFTGGEAVPHHKAAQFEDETGAMVLQFYGSNETGALSRTTTRDSRDRRLDTAGRVIEDMHVRLFDDTGADITSSGGPGQPGCRGPATCIGYYDDEAANAALVRPDGWMLSGDIATIDADGYLRVVGRKSDFIIRGGKNISAVAVEEAASTHPAVRMAAAVAMPSDVFGERVGVYVVLRDKDTLTLDELCAHLEDGGVGKDLWPERLIVVDTLPTSSGGKVAKGELRADISRRLRDER
jgi:acyl-CoA synthetase